MPDVPTAGPGERVWVLAVPFRAPAPGAVWRPDLQAHVWVGAELPPELAPYDPPPYTFERFLEDELNEKPRPLPIARPMTPRDQQWDGADVVAAHAAAGGRVFLLGDDPGVGKTGTAILAARLIAEQRDVRWVLVVADRPAAITIPHWARSIAGFGDGGLRWCVTTWDRLAKVSKLRVRPGHRRRGAHGPAHHDAALEALEGRVRRRQGQGRPVRAGLHGHAGAHPARAALPGAGVRRPARRGVREWSDLPKKLTAHGFHVERGRYGWQWTEDPDERRADLGRLQGWLADADPPATLHRPAPWGPVSVTGTPVALTPAERAAYDSEWSEFRAEMQLARRSRQSAKGRAALLRFRQKAGLIRVQATVDWIKAQVEAERQVAVSVEFVETAADPIREALLDSGIPVAGIFGRDRFDVEAERLRFQRGEAMVCVFTVTASISLHAGELLPDGGAGVGDPAGRPVPPAAVLRHPGPAGHRPHAPRRADLAVAGRVRRGHRRGAGGPGDGRAAGGERIGRRRGHVVPPGDRRAARRRLAARGRPDRRLTMGR